MPTAQSPSVVLDSVSAEAVTANQSAPSSMAVRQQPEQAMEAPSGMLAMSAQPAGTPIIRRMSWPPPIGVMARTVPWPVTIPVNIRLSLPIRSQWREHTR